MNNVLQFHNIQLEILSPVHIGDGSTISKKEYFYDKFNKKIKIFDIPALFSIFTKKGITAENEMIEYLLDKSNSVELLQLLRKYSINANEYVRYQLDTSASNEYDLKKREINSFVKDSYGLPYIPGSTLKGLLKSAIISYRIHNDVDLCRNIKNEIIDAVKYDRANKKYLAQKINSKIEAIFDSEIIDKETSEKKIFKGFSGLIVSDSGPITDRNPLILAQKVDYSLEKKRGSLPIYKESLRPGIKVDFSLTLDTHALRISVDYIKDAINFYQKEAYNNFYKEYGRGEESSDIIWLGGGAGFTSKTVIYQLFGQDAYRICNEIFYKTLGEKTYNKHKHYEYRDDMTPHTCKCTIYKDELFDMGRAKLRFLN